MKKRCPSFSSTFSSLVIRLFHGFQFMISCEILREAGKCFLGDLLICPYSKTSTPNFLASFWFLIKSC
ncbi:67aa long hypothetical protein [Pyrococcus horikoshii OT3]|uniref:Uncharacterized protein n=1 Tax=Pyrococcus horikoshii (strain ATCC 700860 / DSM 12428 / JCM 9974 / NBRC 100139 / OT-3) TaxID=70601 RepID=O73993_PYRHO|nr:67aa long hypothetical protein [Pyrococcus horikoshii OT3]